MTEKMTKKIGENPEKNKTIFDALDQLDQEMLFVTQKNLVALLKLWTNPQDKTAEIIEENDFLILGTTRAKIREFFEKIQEIPSGTDPETLPKIYKLLTKTFPEKNDQFRLQQAQKIFHAAAPDSQIRKKIKQNHPHAKIFRENQEK